MSKFQDLAPWDTNKFIAQVKLEYQEMMMQLAATARLITVPEGHTFTYPVMGALSARPIALGSQLDPQSAKISRIPGILKPSGASVMLDKIEMTFNNIAEVELMIESITLAMKRKMNDVLIEAVTDSTNTDILDIPAGATNLTQAKFLELSQTFNARSIPTTERVFLIGAKTDTVLMSDPNFINNEIFNKGAVEKGTFDGTSIFGFKIIVVPDAVPNDPNGPLRESAPGVVTCLAYHKASVGFARGISTEVSIDRMPLFHNATAIQTAFALDSIVIDGRGIIRVGADTN